MAPALGLPMVFSLSLILSGCGAGLAGAVLGILSLSDRGGGGSPDLPPVVSSVQVSSLGTPDRILLEFRIANEDEGRLSARVEVVRLRPGAGGRLEPDGQPAAATPAPDSEPLDAVDPGRALRLIWDAKQDLWGESSQAQFIVTPIEDGLEGESFRSEVFRAGNTQVSVQNLILASQGYQIVASFQLNDEESDPIFLEKAELSVQGGPFVPLTGALWEKLPKNFSSAPAPRGRPASLVIDLKRLEAPELRDLIEPGYVGELCLRLIIKDYAGEPPTTDEACLRFDNNDAPFVEVLPIPEEDLVSGVVPIRYRVFDPDLNQSNVQVEVDLGDGEGFIRAAEYPSSSSEGTKGLSSLDPSLFGYPGNPFHTFLWDALSQWKGSTRVVVSVLASDREAGTRSVQNVVGFSMSPLMSTEDIQVNGPPFAPTSGDFDGDGFPDLVFLTQISQQANSDNLSYYRGGRRGLSPAGVIGTGESPNALTTADFDGDGFLDVVVVNSESHDLSYLRGGPSGLSRVGEIPAGVGPRDIASGDFDTDGFVDVVVVNYFASWPGYLVHLTYLRGGAGGLVRVGEIAIGFGTEQRALTTGDFDGDGFLDLVVGVTYIRGGPAGLSRVGEIDAEMGGVLASGDFDNDGFLDLVVVGSHLSYIRGGSSGFLRGGEIETGVGPFALRTADFDGDGFLDAVVANRGSNNVTYIRGERTGLVHVRELAVGSFPSAIENGDYDGDGFPDVVVTNYDSGNITYLHGGRDGLSRIGEINTGTFPRGLTNGDFDGDGFLDVVVANASDSLTYMQGGRGAIHRAGEIALAGPITSGDYDGDHFLDMVGYLGTQLAFIRGGFSTPSQPVVFATGFSGIFDSGDFDVDEFSDLVVVNRYSNKVTYFRGGSGGLSTAGYIAVGSFPDALTNGDFDHDGYLDLIVLNKDSNDVTYIRGGKGGLSRIGEISLGGRGTSEEPPSSMTSGDFDGDGFLDLVVSNHSTGEVTYLGGGQAGLSRLGQLPATRGNLLASTTGDFDGDGFVDLVIGVTYLRGGSAGLSRVGEIGDGMFNALTSDDFDGDGFPDIVMANSDSLTSHATFLRGGKDGLTPKGDLTMDGPLAILTTGDFDGDGFPDVVVTLSNGMTILRGGGAGLRWTGQTTVGVGSSLLTKGDFNGDSFTDLVTGSGSNTLTYLRQQYLLSHVNVLIDPVAPTGASPLLLDPRNPARYRLDLATGSLSSAVQVCMVPGPAFDLPQVEAAHRGMFLLMAADPVTILRESTMLLEPARLTLLLRDGQADIDPARLRLFRRGPKTGTGIRVEIRPEEFLLTTLGSGRAVSFPIDRFGTYAAALELDR